MRTSNPLYNRVLWNPKVHNQVYKSLSLRCTLARWIQSTPNISKIHFKLASALLIVHPRDFFPSGLSTEILYTFLISLMCATCPVYVTLLDLTALTNFGEEYKLCSLCCVIFLVHLCDVKYENKLWWLKSRISWAQCTFRARLGYSVLVCCSPRNICRNLYMLFYLLFVVYASIK